MIRLALLFLALSAFMSPAHAADLDYQNLGTQTLSAAAPESTIEKPLRIPGSRLTSIAPALWCRTIDEAFSWSRIRCVLRLASPDGHTRYRRELVSNAPQPSQDLFPGGVDVVGWVVESTCEAQEGLRDVVTCNVTMTATTEE